MLQQGDQRYVQIVVTFKTSILSGTAYLRI